MKRLFGMLFLLVTIFFVNAGEAKSLKKGEVYSLLNGEETIEIRFWHKGKLLGTQKVKSKKNGTVLF